MSIFGLLNKNLAQREPADAELIKLFHTDPDRAWVVFIDRYSDTIFSYLHHLGFDYDQSMDRFVYVCEKLCEQGFRRLKTIRYAGQHGELVPWLRAVVKRLCVNWAWSEDGRRRLFKSIEKLPVRDQRVFEMYFWHGMQPSEIYEALRLEHHDDAEAADVFDSLERIFSHLSQKKLWRLMSNLARRQRVVSLDDEQEGRGPAIDPIDASPNPEEALIAREERERLSRALSLLTDREMLVIALRYEDALAVRDVASAMCLAEVEIKAVIKTAMNKLRRSLK